MTKKIGLSLLFSLLIPIGMAQHISNLNAEEDSMSELKSKFKGVKVELIPTYYKYTEPNLMSLKGINYRIAGDYTFFLTKSSPWLMKINYSSAFGEPNYFSFKTGSSKKEKNYINELKVDVGRVGELFSNPFIYYWGLGYRNLFNDSRGITTTGHKGYRRMSQYIYINGGADWILALSESWNFHLNPEMAILLFGVQKSYLKDAGSGGETISNNQTIGVNFKLHPTFEFSNHLLLGVYADFWWLDQSEGVPAGGGLYFVEPENNTIEVGLSAGYKF